MEDKVQLKLHIENLNDHTYNDDYWFDTVSLGNFNIRKPYLQQVIEYLHDDLDWDETPTIGIVKQRILFGSRCHLHMYKNKCLGWHWTNDKFITKDWLTPHKQLKPTELYIGGAFISKKAKPSASSSYYLYRQGFEYSFNFHNSKIMYLYSDNWNRASAQLCYKCGFVKSNFL